MPKKENLWLGVAKSVLATLLVSAILGTAGAVGSTWLEVKLLRRDVDELRKDLDRLWSDVSDNVAALQSGPDVPAPGLHFTTPQQKLAADLAAARERLAEIESVVPAAAAAPAATPPPSP